MLFVKAKLYDGLAFFKHTTLKKIINFFKIRCSFYFSLIFKRAFVWGFPYSISIEPTSICNLHCVECPTGLNTLTRQSGNMDFHTFQRIVDELQQQLLFINLYFQGEPFLNPSLFDFINYASKKNIYTSTSTNGHYLSKLNSENIIKSHLDKIIISMDGTDQETYATYRKGGKLNLVIEGIKNLVEAKIASKSVKPYIIVQFLVLKTNEHQLLEMKKLAKEIGVDELQFKTAQLYDFAKGNCLIPNNDKYTRYKKEINGNWILKKAISNKCYKMWHSCVITWNGDLVPCCFDKNANFKFGNIIEKPINRIWKSNEYKNYRTTILKNRRSISICRNCSE
ncbi:MAG: radical SAM protein [Bacteroidetes bacterium CG2_30_32_10]|nr:MAG: radical SAM protein [Bacteroidetes bacterium CG2_30_32_10]